MTKPQHTKGPWIVNNTIFDGAICRWHIASHKYGSAYPICEHVFEGKPSSEEQIANARLIAAAPDLFDAISNLLDGIDTHMVDVSSPADELLQDALRKMRNAVKKVKEIIND